MLPAPATNNWFPTDPRAHQLLWAEANDRHCGRLVPLAKMLKAWNVTRGYVLKSFHLECLLISSLAHFPLTTYQLAIKRFFEHACERYLAVPDPAGYGCNVVDYLDTKTKREDVRKGLSRALEFVIGAVDYEAIGNEAHAFMNWQRLFTSCFPALGPMYPIKKWKNNGGGTLV